MILFKTIVYFLLVFSYNGVNSEDIFATINTKKSLNFVDEKFISVVIDPMILLGELNISTTTRNIASHLSPALIRFQGPSTPSFTFSGGAPKEDRLTVTPPMWVNLNEWLVGAGLTPVFALTDVDRVNEQWDARMVLPLMELSDRMGLECYWEIDHYYPNKMVKQIINDVDALNHIQEAFPRSRKRWHTVVGDMSKSNYTFEKVTKIVHALNGKVKALNWNPASMDGHDILTKYVMTSRPKIPVWTNAPRFPDPTTFTNGLMWAKYLGDSAKQGYSVIFRSPKIRELFEVTPSYWVSVLHKQLMGRYVLETRSSNLHYESQTSVYAHCAKQQNSYKRRGAVTIFMVNMQENPVNSSVRFIGSPMMNVEVQSYVLTSPEENSSTVLLNGELLDDTELPDGKLQLAPQIRTSQVGKFLTLALPARSIGYFVIPNALSTLCIHEEEMDMIKGEIKADHEKEILKEYTDTKTSETLKHIANVEDLYKIMEKELHSNENYYHDAMKRKEWRQLLVKRMKEQKEKIENSTTKFQTDEEKQEILNKIQKMEHEEKSEPRPSDKDIDHDMTIIPAEPEKILEANEDIKKLLNQPDLEVPLNENTNNYRLKREIIGSFDTEGFEARSIDESSESKRHESNANSAGSSCIKEKYIDDGGSLEFGETYVYDKINHDQSTYIESEEEDFSKYDLDNYKDQLTSEEYFICEKLKDNQRLEQDEIIKLEQLLYKHNIPIIFDAVSRENSNSEERLSKSQENNSEPAKYDSKSDERHIKFTEQHENCSKSHNTDSKRHKREISEVSKQKYQAFKNKIEERKKRVEENKAALKARRAEKKIKAAIKKVKRMAVINVADDNNMDHMNPIDSLAFSMQYIINTENKSQANEIVKTTESTLQDLTCPVNFTNDHPLFKKPIVLVIGKPVNLSKIFIDEQKREKQLRLLKERLALKKRLNEKRARYFQFQEEMRNNNDLTDVRRKRGLYLRPYPLQTKVYHNYNKINEISNVFDKSEEDLFNKILKDENIMSNYISETDDPIYKLTIPKINMYKNGENYINEASSSTEPTTTTITKTMTTTEMTTLASSKQEVDYSKEAEILFNDISKEGKFMSNIMQELEDEPYKIKIPKIQMYKNGKIYNKEDTQTTRDLQTTAFNIEEGSTLTQKGPTQVTNLFEEATTGTGITNDRHSSNNYGKEGQFVPKFTILNDAFGTMARVLNNLHDRVVNYAVYLTE